jgi:hypothetical protein
MAVFLILGMPVFGDGGVFVPWEEMKTLYREKLEREFEKAFEEEPQVYSIDEARYRVRLRSEGAEIEVLVSGKSVSGKPAPIPLFGKDAVVTSVGQVTGGTVMTPSDLDATAILPDSAGIAFQVVARLLAEAVEDSGAKSICVSIPRALQNVLELDVPAGLQLLKAQGIADGDGVYRFSASPSLTIRYAEKERLEAATVIQVDSISRVVPQRGRTIITTHFLPIRPLPESVTFRTPPGAQFLSTSLRNASIQDAGPGRVELKLPNEHQKPFTMEWAQDAPADTSPIMLTLPAIEGNGGQQGRFVIDEPEDGQIAVSAEGTISRVPVERLPEPLRQAAAGAQFCMSVAAESAITLTSTTFQAVSTPPTVLESVYLFSSFEENGNVLSVLIMDVPPEVGPRLSLKAVPGAEIWSLKVNGIGKKVYEGDEGSWMIPLDGGAPSHVELAFLDEKEKLGLQGRLEASVPETGLAAQEVRVGIALPSRVELLSIEGPVSPAKGDEWPIPAEFIGSRHYFSRAFYKGEGMALAVSYKEPVESLR